MKLFDNGNWGLKLLALILAIVIYHALKDKPERPRTDHDRNIFQQQ